MLGENSKICLQSSCNAFRAETSSVFYVVVLLFLNWNSTELTGKSNFKPGSELPHVLECHNQCPLVYLSCKAQMLKRTSCQLLLVSHAETFQRIWWSVCLMLVQQPKVCPVVGIQSCHSCQQPVQLTLPLQTRCVTVTLWELLTWWGLWCRWKCCKLILVLLHPIPRQSHTQWRTGQPLGTEWPFQSCWSIRKKILIFRLRQTISLKCAWIPFFSLLRQDSKKEKDASQVSKWQLKSSQQNP